MSSIISAKVAKEMEAAILSGQLKPRERLVEMDLISRFGGSRTVIREALKRLEAKGLIRTVPYRGAMVADLTVEEIEEIYFVRAAIEKLAARLVIKNIRADEIQNLKRLTKEVENHLRRKTDQMIEKDSEFHQAIFRICRNQYLNDMINFLKTKAHIVGYNAWSLPDRIEQSIQEHRQIMAAIEAKNAALLEKLIVKHLAFSKNSYLDQLRGSDRWSSTAREINVG
jgi:DNA-binding GntR family transcriptional regulator